MRRALRAPTLLLACACVLVTAPARAQEPVPLPTAGTAAPTASDLAAQASTAFREGRTTDALALYESALALAAESDRAILVFDIAACHLALSQWSEARARFEEVATLDPSIAPLALAHAAVAAARSGDLEAAEALLPISNDDPEIEALRTIVTEAIAEDRARRDAEAQAAALAAAPSSDVEQSATEEAPIFGMRSGIFAWGAVSLGWNTNPAQGGGAARTGLTAFTTASGAPTVTIDAMLRYSLRPSARTLVRLQYVPGAFVLATRDTQSLSLTNHELTADVAWTNSRELELRAGAHSSCSWLGIRGIAPFVCDGYASGRFDVHTSTRATTRLTLDVGGQRAFGDYAYLSGATWLFEAAERIARGRYVLDLGLRVRQLRLGTLSSSISSASFATCDARCDGATYRIPSGYAELAPFVAFDVAATSRVTFRSRIGVEGRRYDAASGITGVPESEKRRLDLRARLRLRAEVALGYARTAALFAQYDALFSDSNIAFDAADANHAFDYNDRRFAQHAIAVGVEAWR